MVSYLDADHWLHNAKHANRTAKLLRDGLQSLNDVRLPWATDANEVFAILPKPIHRALAEAGIKAAPWFEKSISLPHGDRVNEGEVFWRFVTSFVTRDEDIQRVIEIARKA